MIIYKYGLNQDLEFEVVPCEIIKETDKFYYLRAKKRSISLEKANVDIFINKCIYSFSLYTKEKYLDNIKEHYDRIIKDYENKMQNAKETLALILDKNK